MAPRVVTADIESMVGYPVLAVVGMPYRDGEAVPGPLANGRYVDVLARLPPGITDATNASERVYEIPPASVARLRRDDGGPLHTFAGFTRLAAPLDPDDESDAATLAAPRLAVLTVDLGARLNARLDRVRPVPRGDGRAVCEALIESPSDNATRPADWIFDAIDDHPIELGSLMNGRSEQARRKTPADAPPAWGQRGES